MSGQALVQRVPPPPLLRSAGPLTSGARSRRLCGPSTFKQAGGPESRAAKNSEPGASREESCAYRPRAEKDARPPLPPDRYGSIRLFQGLGLGAAVVGVAFLPSPLLCRFTGWDWAFPLC